jgi:hypothetical protein
VTAPTEVRPNPAMLHEPWCTVHSVRTGYLFCEAEPMVGPHNLWAVRMVGVGDYLRVFIHCSRTLSKGTAVDLAAALLTVAAQAEQVDVDLPPRPADRPEGAAKLPRWALKTWDGDITGHGRALKPEHARELAAELLARAS